jgi:cell pole-organizing protein PopZ
MAEQTRTSQEPSMEEILSSIRRIIADEDTSPPPPAARAASAPPSSPDPGGDGEDEEVLELTEMVEPPRAEVPPPVPPAAAQRPSFMERPPRTEPPARSPAMAATQASDSLISPGTATASTNAMAKLARAGLTEPRENGTGFGDLTVEKLLRDLLTPMLKDWLDQNLPAIVERVVEQEVKKLARRAELL